jgi:two-component system chemotaxis response regulator CheV
MNKSILLEAGTNELEIVEFYLDETGEPDPYRGHYGVNVAKVLEIINLPQITALPNAKHPAIIGAFNHRSEVIPLIDLNKWLEKNDATTGSPKVIITEFNNILNAFLVSGVTRIHRLSWEDVEPPDAYVASCTQSSITGVVKVENRIVFILDLERIIADLNTNLGMKSLEHEGHSQDQFYKALVVDDSTMIRNLLKEQLSKASFDIQTATNGLDAWNALMAIKEGVVKNEYLLQDVLHIIVSDIEMPSMDGLNLTKRIKADEILKDVPVILFSSLITDKLKHKGEAVGADDQISKPEVGDLAKRALQLIEERKARHLSSER